MFIDEIAKSVRTGEITGQCSFLESLWSQSGTDADGSKFVSGRFGLPGGWDFSMYDTNRDRLAREIIRLIERK